ncbi:hypothetical protein B0H14DRAFT_3139609 [Mycena olivaceomarginata]|nr:hypothetical protein B0H14DRAFT_3139609 [Mycena olivaceomarginata]
MNKGSNFCSDSMTRIIPESDSLFQREAFSQNLVRRLGIKAWESECSKKDVIFKAIICAVSITMHTAMNSDSRWLDQGARDPQGSAVERPANSPGRWPARQTFSQHFKFSTTSGHVSFDKNLPPSPQITEVFLYILPQSRKHNPGMMKLGHSIIPGTVPVGTLLYHGRGDNELPTVPEWTAIDPEHSFPFCGVWDGSNTDSGCWQLTMVATRPLNFLYFDGSSAANIRDAGTLEAQDLLVWGKFDPERWVDERERVNDLCAWGKDFGIDGYLRMEMDFEIMLCDFSQVVELVSADNLASWWTNPTTLSLLCPTSRSTPNFHPPASSDSLDPLDDDPSFPAGDIFRFETVRAGSWRNHYPGETRIILDLTGAASARALTHGPNAGSGVEWRSLYRVVLERYFERLELMEYLLNTTTADNINERARHIQTQLRVMLTPYILYTSRPTPRGISHTAHIHANTDLQSRLTSSERLLLRTLDETNREICRVVVRMWVAGVHAGLDALIPLEDNQTVAAPPLVVQEWRLEAGALMKWLDWGVWVKCRPECGVEEICYLPTWPYFRGPDRTEDERWKRPQPRCIRQFAPYSVLPLNAGLLFD